jgi:hypothetical protein
LLEQRISWLWLLLTGRCWWLIPTLSFAALGAVNFSYFADALFYRYDGVFILTMVTAQKKWMAPGIDFSLNFLEGLGDIWIPTITSLIPGFLLGGLLDNDHWMPVIACFVFAMEFFLSTLIFGWCAGAGRVTSLAAALIGALFTLPFVIPTLAAWRIWGNPHFMTAIATTTLTLCAFLTIGRTRMRTDVALVTAILVLQSYLIVSQPVRAAIAAVMLAFFGTAAMLGAEGKDERRRKLIAAGLIVAILASAFGGYLFGLFYYARTTFFWNDVASFPVDWTQQSFLISESRVAGPYIWGACLAGAALSAWREHGRLRLLALTFLLFVAVQQAIFLPLQLANATWSGPPTAYIDMFALPFYALFGAYLLIGSWAQSFERTRWAMLALVIVPWGSVLALYKPYSVLLFHQQNPFLWPPHHTPITQQLQNEIGLTDGSPFRGRVANIAGTERDPQYSWLPLISQHYYDAVVALYTGNDHRNFGLWYFGIPTLIADNQFSSPFFHVINSRLLSNSTQKHVRQLTTITRFEPRIFAMLGVRFVITSRALAGLTPSSSYVVVPEHPDIWSLFLYELSDAKTAGYWAVRPTKVETTRQAMLWMIDSASTADSTVYEPLQTSLVAGTASQLRVFRDHLVVEAESPGTSLLVLPVEFSHCFDVRFRESDQARFLRANINQGALLFSGHLRAELQYRYAPWHFGCRLRDIEDARRLKLSEVGWPQ